MKTTLVLLASVMLVLGTIGIAFAVTQQSVAASVTVSGALSVTVSNSTLSFGSLSEGDSDRKPTEDPLSITVDSNVVYDLTTRGYGDGGNNFNATGAGVLAMSELEWDTSDTFPGTAYTTSDVLIADDDSGDNSYDLYHELSIPIGTLADTYSLDVTIKVTQV
jgi:hypothetical protein